RPGCAAARAAPVFGPWKVTPANGLSVEVGGTAAAGVFEAVDVEPVAVGALVGAGAPDVVPPGGGALVGALVAVGGVLVGGVLVGGVLVAVRGVVLGGVTAVRGAGRTFRACSMAGSATDDAGGATSGGVTSPAPSSTAPARPQVHSPRLAGPARCPRELDGAER
ncbi:MAG TPA: hypothetical protein VJ352_11530, partial [Geodermatophilus sp.]|nr:hypothetical protein [Geodermatophilus sp.]